MLRGQRAFCCVMLAGVLTSGCVVAAQTDTAGAASTSGAQDAAISLEKMQQLIDRGKAADALVELDKAAALAVVPAGVERLRGMALYSENKLTDAEAAFAAAMARDAGDATAQTMRGITLFRLGRPKDAIPFLETTGKDAANGPVDPHYVLALCYLDTRRYDDARHAFALQYGFPPDSASAYLLAARMLLRREYIPVAQQFAMKALEISPNLPLAHRLLGEAELAGNHLDEAIAQFDLERQSNPLDAWTYDRLGDAYIRKGDYGAAKHSLQESVLLDPNVTGSFILLGKALLKEQDAVGASAYLEHARDMDPKNYMTHSLLGQAYRLMGRADDARSETELAQKLQVATEPKLLDVK